MLCIVSLLLGFSFASLASAQQIQPQPSHLNPQLEQRRSEQTRTAEPERVAAISAVERLAGTIMALEDVRARAMGVARLASALWSQDEPAARLLFEKALSFTNSQTINENQEGLPALRRNVIAILARRDPEWAKVLIDAAEASEKGLKARSATNIITALTLLDENADVAVQFAERSLEGGGVVNHAFLQFLLDLRKSQEASANQLFLYVLAHLGQQRAADVRQFHSLGIYLFTAPDLLDSDSYAITRVGDILVPNIVADRPGIPRPLIRAYLQIAVNVIWRAVPDPAQQQQSYALAYLLLPKSRNIAPELAAPIEAAMSALSSRVPAGLRQESAYKYINAVPLSDEERLVNAGNRPDEESRDIAYLDLALQSWRRGDFKTARTAAGRIGDHATTQRLNVLIDFGEGAWLLKKSPKLAADAKTVADKLPQSIERTILLLAIAQVGVKNGNLAQAEEAVDLALGAARTIADARRPFLVLLAVARLADINPSAVPIVLAEVIKDFNSFDEAAYAAVDWAQTVQSGPLKARFPLDINSVDFSFNRAFRSVASADLDTAMARAEELRNENLRAQGLVEVGTVVLERLAKNIPQDQHPIRVGEDGIRKSASKTVMPNYPQGALNKKQQGVAVVELQYDGKGDVTNTDVLEAPGNIIADAVVAAVRQWKFVPSKRQDGTPVSIRGKLTFYFRIDENGKGHVENPKQFRQSKE